MPSTQASVAIEKPPKREDLSESVLHTLRYLFGSIMVGLLLTIAAGTYGAGPSVVALGWGISVAIWGIGFLAVGALVGFLFAIPRAVHDKRTDEGRAVAGATTSAMGNPTPALAPSASSYFVNNNISEISDWLTKIIVGLGLVQLHKIPALLGGLATFMASSSGDAPRAAALSVSVFVYFTPIGFLTGYLVMRLVLQSDFMKSDLNLTMSSPTASLLEARLTTAEHRLARTEAAHTSAAPQSSQPESNQGRIDSLMVEARSIAKRYMDISVPDISQRVSMKNRVAVELGTFILTNRIPVERIANETDEGMLLGVAEAALLNPTDCDPALVLLAAQRVKVRLHVKYRMLLALGILVRANRLTSEQRTAVRLLCHEYAKRSDDSLMTLINETLRELS